LALRKKEQRLYDALLKAKPSWARLERIENVVGEGTPDVHVMVPGKSAWLELKAPTPPKRASTRLLGDEGLRQSQKNWLLEATVMGLPAYVLIRDSVRKEVFLLRAELHDLMNDMTVAELRRHSLADSLEAAYEVLRENRADGASGGRL